MPRKAVSPDPHVVLLGLDALYVPRLSQNFAMWLTCFMTLHKPLIFKVAAKGSNSACSNTSASTSWWPKRNPIRGMTMLLLHI